MAGTGASPCCAVPLMEPVLKGIGSSAVWGTGPGRASSRAAEGEPLGWSGTVLERCSCTPSPCGPFPGASRRKAEAAVGAPARVRRSPPFLPGPLPGGGPGPRPRWDLALGAAQASARPRSGVGPAAGGKPSRGRGTGRGLRCGAALTNGGAWRTGRPRREAGCAQPQARRVVCGRCGRGWK